MKPPLYGAIGKPALHHLHLLCVFSCCGQKHKREEKKNAQVFFPPNQAKRRFFSHSVDVFGVFVVLIVFYMMRVARYIFVNIKKNYTETHPAYTKTFSFSPVGCFFFFNLLIPLTPF